MWLHHFLAESENLSTVQRTEQEKRESQEWISEIVMWHSMRSLNGHAISLKEIITYCIPKKHKRQYENKLVNLTIGKYQQKRGKNFRLSFSLVNQCIFIGNFFWVAGSTLFENNLQKIKF